MAKKENEEGPVKKGMLIGEVVRAYPESAMVMMDFGLHCIGCHVSYYETIEEGCKGHGMDDAKIDEMISEVNKAIAENKQ